MSEEKVRTITCIVCPKGCKIDVRLDENGNIKEITGFGCPKGKEYAYQEVTAPKRIVMSVIKVEDSIFPTVSVKTSKPVPKNLMFEVIKQLAKVKLKAPIPLGYLVIKNVADTDADIVTTRPAPVKG